MLIPANYTVMCFSNLLRVNVFIQLLSTCDDSPMPFMFSLSKKGLDYSSILFFPQAYSTACESAILK